MGLRCPSCGEEVLDDSPYCNSCGTTLGSLPQEPVATSASSPTTQNLKKPRKRPAPQSSVSEPAESNVPTAPTPQPQIPAPQLQTPLHKGESNPALGIIIGLLVLCLIGGLIAIGVYSITNKDKDSRSNIATEQPASENQSVHAQISELVAETPHQVGEDWVTTLTWKAMGVEKLSLSSPLGEFDLGPAETRRAMKLPYSENKFTLKAW